MTIANQIIGSLKNFADALEQGDLSRFRIRRVVLTEDQVEKVARLARLNRRCGRKRAKMMRALLRELRKESS